MRRTSASRRCSSGDLRSCSFSISAYSSLTACWSSPPRRILLASISSCVTVDSCCTNAQMSGNSDVRSGRLDRRFGGGGGTLSSSSSLRLLFRLPAGDGAAVVEDSMSSMSSAVLRTKYSSSSLSTSWILASSMTSPLSRAATISLILFSRAVRSSLMTQTSGVASAIWSSCRTSSTGISGTSLRGVPPMASLAFVASFAAALACSMSPSTA